METRPEHLGLILHLTDCLFRHCIERQAKRDAWMEWNLDSN